MVLKKSLPDQFTIFAFIWSAATISHQFYYGLIFSSNLDSLLTLLAFITILQPFRYKLFLIQVFVQVVTIFNQLPYVFNHWFLSFDNAREKIEIWRRDYNEFRPHSALDNMTPEEYVKKHLKKTEISNLRGTAFV